MSDNLKRRGRRQFLILAALFLAPVLGAYLVYFPAPGLAPEGTTNYGELESPVRPLPEESLLTGADGEPADAALTGLWTLVLRADGACDEVCEANLILTRQVRLALNNKRTRVQRLLVVDTPERAAELSERYGEPHPHLLVAAGSPRLDAFLQLPHAELLLLDPNGNAVMRYRPLQTPDGVQQDFKGIRKDLKKLLRLSNIG